MVICCYRVVAEGESAIIRCFIPCPLDQHESSVVDDQRFCQVKVLFDECAIDPVHRFAVIIVVVGRVCNFNDGINGVYCECKRALMLLKIKISL